MRAQIVTVTAVMVTGVPSLWRVGGQGWAAAIRKGGSSPFRRHAYRKRQGAEAAIAAMQSSGKLLAINWPLVWVPSHATTKRSPETAPIPPFPPFG